MILPPIPGPFWKSILPNVKLKECSSNAVVLSMNSTDYNNNEQWDASVSLRKLEKLRINKKFEDLMEPTQLLIHLILKEFHSYVLRD